MSAPSLAPSVAFERPVLARQTFGPSIDIQGVNALAVRSLLSLFNVEQNLFAQRAVSVEEKIVNQGTTRRGTVIALLGLQHLGQSGYTLPLDVASVRDEIFRNTSWIRTLGDLGLTTWLAAEWEPAQLETLFAQFDFWRALEIFSDGRQGRTTEISWFLAGIAHAKLSYPEKLPDLTDTAAAAYRLLMRNQGEGGIFGHLAVSRGVLEPLRRRFGTFDDQIHAIYALSRFGKAFDIDEPIDSALSCANAVCALQGEMGQWWWLYDRRRSRVAAHYPVRSQFHDGLAPLALLALAEMTGQTFHESIEKGLVWMAGENELGQDIRDRGRGCIWEGIESSGWVATYWDAALNFVNVSRAARLDRLKIRYELRPEHFGWLLYSFGGFGLPKTTLTAEISKTQ